jgi:hypothetical protein
LQVRLNEKDPSEDTKDKTLNTTADHKL